MGYGRRMNYERSLLEQKTKRDEEMLDKEKAAKKVVQQILAEEYRKEMEKKRLEKEAEANAVKQKDAALVNQLMVDTDPKIMGEMMVLTVLLIRCRHR